MNDNQDYRDTVFLPATQFPMRGDLPKKEPALLARWERMGIWKRLREASAGREKFILHDGPPYANGNIHIGTALNKILKDVVNRAGQMGGYDGLYIPGWDCHGLPIEWKIEEQYRAKKRDKDAVPVLQFRAECRDYAAHWMGVQEAEFRRLGVHGRLGRAIRHHGFPLRGGDRRGNRQVSAQRRAVPRPAAGDVVAGGEDRAGRGRDRVLRPHQHDDLRPLSGRSPPARRSCAAPQSSSGPPRPGPCRATAPSPAGRISTTRCCGSIRSAKARSPAPASCWWWRWRCWSRPARRSASRPTTCCTC